MFSQDEQNAIDAFLSYNGINLAAVLRAEKSGCNIDNLRLEMMRKLRDTPWDDLLNLPVILEQKTSDSGLNQP